MSFKHYTTCFRYEAGGEKPFNDRDLPLFGVKAVLAALVTGSLGALLGLLGGPVGAGLGGFAGVSAAIALMVEEAADKWLNRRLVCLSGDDPKCAVGTVSFTPRDGGLGAFDNDQFFNVVLMPHPVKDAEIEEGGELITARVPANRYEFDWQTLSWQVAEPYRDHVSRLPENDILADGFQGAELLAPGPGGPGTITGDLGYDNLGVQQRVALHCEAEGDFWVRMRKLAPAIGILLAAALAVIAAAAAGGGSAGAAAGCAAGLWFFGAIGCAIGTFLGALLGGAAGAAAAAALAWFGGAQPTLQAIFDADKGDVEDANVGDSALGSIKIGDRVAVLGTHVYDGYHKGWNEFHPLMAVMKLDEFVPFIQWDPNGNEKDVPSRLVPAAVGDEDLELEDMREGLASPKFRKRCELIKMRWCDLIHEAFDRDLKIAQQSEELRWAVHPLVDGCVPRQEERREPA